MERQDVKVACLQALPASLAVQVGKESAGWVSICGTLPGYACEGGNREEAIMVGLLHVPRDLWRVGDREAPGVNLKPAGFQGQGPGISVLPKITNPWLGLKVLT